MTTPEVSPAISAPAATGRATWSVLDQGLSSIASFIPFLLVLHTSTTTQVGAFGLAYFTFFLILTVIRGLALEPLVVRHRSRTTDQFRPLALDTERRGFDSGAGGSALLGPLHRRTAAAAAVGLAASASAVVGFSMAAVFLIVGGTLAEAFVPLGLLLPALLVNDAWRQVFFASLRPRMAFANDLFYVLLLVALYAVVGTLMELNLVMIVTVWGLAALGAALFGGIQARTVPDIGGARRWLRRHRDLGPANAIGYAVHRGVEQITMIAVGIIGGLATVGAMTGARALFAPMTTVQSGVSSWALPEAARRTEQGTSASIRRFSYAFAGTFAVLMLMAGAALSVVPSGIGEQLFNETWRPGRQLLLPMTAFSAMNAADHALAISLRATEKANQLLRFRVTTGLVTITLATAGVMVSGAAGAVWGMTAGSALFVIAASAQLYRVQPRASRD